MPLGFNFTLNFITANTKQDLTDVAGVALDGTLILTAASTQGTDPYYPKGLSAELPMIKLTDMDTCLGSVDPSTQTYSYRMLSPCLAQGFTPPDQSCDQSPECSGNLHKYATSPHRNSSILGIAKDGRVLVGPYIGGSLVDCL